MCGIYCIENLVNGKKYIGQSIHIEDRIKHHKTLLNSKVATHHNIYLQNAWDKYGENNFNFYVLEECDESQLDDKEKYWSEFYQVYDTNNGYALKTAGQGFGNRIISEEARKKISEANKGANNYWYGKKMAEEARQKMKENHYDCFGINNPKCRQVLQYDFDGCLLAEYNYIREAAYKTGVNENCIQDCCAKRSITAGGFIWRYKFDPLVNYNKQDYFKNPRCKMVIQYNLNGVVVNTYSSLKEASKLTNTNYTSLANACRKVSKTAGGFIWRYEDNQLSEDEIKNLNYNPIVAQEKKTMVDQYSKDGQFIATWESLSQAGRELNISEPHISECIRDNRRTAGGFIWKRHTKPLTT